jgi:mannobiose 2-epimerase
MPRLVAFAAALLTAVVTSGAQPSPDAAARLRARVPELQRHLERVIVDFWYPRTIDREHGGYLLAHGRDNARLPNASKQIVTQARMVWLFSRLAEQGSRGDAMREAATHGYRFLMDRMWDRRHGGFVWQVDESGTRVLSARKVTYGQAFGLYALSAYARATGDAAALDRAAQLFALLDEHAHDDTHGGYVEVREPDWSAVPAGTASPIGGPAGAKLMNTHLHMMEAVAEYYRASHDARARERLHELLAIESNTVVRKDLPACTDPYREDWTPIIDAATSVVSYGHDLENIWLIVDANEAIGQPSAPYVDLFTHMFEYSVQYGWDQAEGGFFYRGPFRTAAADRQKVWWVQAEALVSALTMFRLTGDARYVEIFERTWQWIVTRQADTSGGDWFAEIWPDGSVRGAKADQWKAGYHNGRALLESIRLIGAL